jgi:hypothetical protein
MNIDTSRLENVRLTPDGFTCACPVCRKEGGDSTRSHLRVYNTGAFSCIKAGKDIVHNRAIRAILRGFIDGSDNSEIVYIEPKLDVETVYPESMLSSLLPDHSYWVKRGVKESVISLLQGGISPDNVKSKLSNRYVIPIRGLSGQINGFSGRILTDSTYAPKYKHLFRSSQACFPFHIVGNEIQRTKTAVLLEGWSDWLFVHQAGVHNALCLFGLNINSTIISTLIGSGVKRVIVSLNRDDDPRKGQAAANKIAEKLGNFFSDVRIVLPSAPYKDYGEMAEKGDDAAFDILRKELL